MKRWKIIAIISAALLLTTTAVYVKADSNKPENQPVNANTLLVMVNKERAKYGVAPLVVDERLNRSAQLKADDMVKYNYFGHEKDGFSGYKYVFKTAPGVCAYASENIVTNSKGKVPTNEEAIDWWIHSKAHHDAMINRNYTLTGFGINGNKVVQHFCTVK